jgi:hypothetical protein
MTVRICQGEKTPDSMGFNCEIDSNEIDESDLHSTKHDDPRISTLHGIVYHYEKNVPSVLLK